MARTPLPPLVVTVGLETSWLVFSPFLLSRSSRILERQAERTWNTLALFSSVSPSSSSLRSTLFTGRAQLCASDRPLPSALLTLVKSKPMKAAVAASHMIPTADVSQFQFICLHFRVLMLIILSQLPLHQLLVADLSRTDDTASRTASSVRAELLLVVLPEVLPLLAVAPLSSMHRGNKAVCVKLCIYK